MDDYVSMIGFVLFYLHHLKPPCRKSSGDSYEQFGGARSPISTQVLPPLDQHFELRTNAPAGANRTSQPLLLLSGYSYGSLITTYLPPTSTIVSSFAAALPGTAKSEIRLRAQHLAEQVNLLFASIPPPARIHRRGRSFQAEDLPRAVSSGGVRIGGEESSPEVRRMSRESSRISLDSPRLRRSVDRMRSVAKHPTHHPIRQLSFGSASRKSSERSPEASGGHDTAETVGASQAAKDPSTASVEIAVPRTAYLLVSPLQGPVSGLATMWTLPSAPRKRLAATADHKTEAYRNLMDHETLAIFGDEDLFSSHKKLRAWARRLELAEGSRFQSSTVEGAGHFWHEPGVAALLRHRISTWVVQLSGAEHGMSRPTPNAV